MLSIRHATRRDSQALRQLHAQSLRTLGTACYSDEVLHAFIEQVGTLDERLLDDGTYYAAFVNTRLAGCGGWTPRQPDYVRHLAGNAGQQARDLPTIRSLYIHPDFARRGIARKLMAVIEDAIAVADHDRIALSATLNAVAFYRRLGYRSVEPAVLRMPGGLQFVAVKMEKRLASARAEDHDAA